MVPPLVVSGRTAATAVAARALAGAGRYPKPAGLADRTSGLPSGYPSVYPQRWPNKKAPQNAGVFVSCTSSFVTDSVLAAGFRKGRACIGRFCHVEKSHRPFRCGS